jgi:hypothetical protein
MKRIGILNLLATMAVALAATLSGVAHAASITPGNLVIYRVGDGQAALANTATAVFLDEYTTAGALVQSIPLPTTGATALTAVGNATTEGIISKSQDGQTLVFTGYRKDVGGTNPAADAQTVTTRLVGTVGLPGLVDTSVGVSDAGTVTIRSATTVGAGNPYYIDTSAAVRYIGAPGPTSTSVVIDARNSRQVNLLGNILFSSNGSTAIVDKVQSYGTLPVAATVPTPVATQAMADAVNGFVVFDLDAGVAGPDTVYALNTVAGRLRKFTFNGTTWTQNGEATTSAANIAGEVSGANVNLYLTTGASLFTFTDTGGAGGALAGTLSAAIATAGTNTAFRGVGVFPIPEPASLGLAALTGLALIAARRRR